MPPIYQKKFDDLEVTVWDDREHGGGVTVYLDNKKGGSIKLPGDLKAMNDVMVLLGNARDKIMGIR